MITTSIEPASVDVRVKAWAELNRLPSQAHIIYCWRCNTAEALIEGRASRSFREEHIDHQKTTQIIQLTRSDG